MYPLNPDSLLKTLFQRRWHGVGRNVVFLGLTSMLTDISSEMVVAVLPVYLMFAIGLTPLQFGLIDGISQGVGALVRLASGVFADRWQRNREVAAVGYGLSAACRLLLLAAGNVWALIATAILLDRIGKGVRTGPRDALISLSSSPERWGLAFGLHRAMDTVGALLGPLVAFAILALMPLAYDLIFVVSFCFAVIGLAALLSFVRNVRTSVVATDERRTPWAEVLSVFRIRPFLSLARASFLLGIVTVADAFFFLMLQRKMSMDVAAFPLLFVVTAFAYLLLAIPAGRLGDRIGRGRVFLLGHGLLLLACAGLLVLPGGMLAGALLLGLLGAYYACTDGVLMAAASRFVPEELRATGLAAIAAALGVSRLLASIIFGALWNWQGIETAIGVFTLGLGVALLVTRRTIVGLEAPT